MEDLRKGSVITVQIAPALSLKRRIASRWALFLLRAIKLRSTRWMKALVSALLPDSSFMSVHIITCVCMSAQPQRVLLCPEILRNCTRHSVCRTYQLHSHAHAALLTHMPENAAHVQMLHTHNPPDCFKNRKDSSSSFSSLLCRRLTPLLLDWAKYSMISSLAIFALPNLEKGPVACIILPVRTHARN